MWILPKKEIFLKNYSIPLALEERFILTKSIRFLFLFLNQELFCLKLLSFIVKQEKRLKIL